jgi:hypothetical protein
LDFLIEHYGGIHHGYFMPRATPDGVGFSFPGLGYDGPADVAVAMFTFPDEESYRRYREMVQPTQSANRPRPSSGKPVALLAMNVYFFSLCKEREELTKRQPHTGLVQAGLRSAKLHDRCGDLSTVAIANTPVVRRKRTQHRASLRCYQFRCVVPHVSDCAAYLPGLHLFRWIRPEQIRWQMILTAVSPICLDPSMNLFHLLRYFAKHAIKNFMR